MPATSLEIAWDVLAGSRAHAVPQIIEPNPSLPSVILDRLMAEVSVAAAHCAVLASCFNGLEAGQTKAGLRSMFEWVPREQALISLVRQNKQLDCDITLDPDAVQSIEDLFAEIEFGQRTLLRLFAEANVIGEHRAIVVYLGTLRSTWQASCRRAQQALFDLLVVAVSIRNRKTHPPLAELMQLLEDASNGKCPCLDNEGQATFKALPHFRLMPRYLITQDCVVAGPAGKARAFAKDISMAGIGLENVPHLRDGEQVVVELSSGRGFTGRVVWVSGTAAGVKFDRMLRQGDPLLGG